MNSVPNGVQENDLVAFVDGRLPAERVPAVDAYLQAHPEERARLQQYREQQGELRRAFALQEVDPFPSSLRVARLLAGRRQRRRLRLALAASAAGLLILGGVGGWTARDRGIGLPSQNAQAVATAHAITTEALAAHQVFSVENRHPVEVDAAQETHLVGWLSKRLGRPLVVPDLTSVGCEFMGGRLLPSENGPAAQFMYRKGNSRLTLYERPDKSAETGLRYSEEDGIGVVYWSDRNFGYALSAKVDPKELRQLAEIVYRQTSSEGSKPKPGKAS
jgi:anti-sigma factor RsiW